MSGSAWAWISAKVDVESLIAGAANPCPPVDAFNIPVDGDVVTISNALARRRPDRIYRPSTVRTGTHRPDLGRRAVRNLYAARPWQRPQSDKVISPCRLIAALAPQHLEVVKARSYGPRMAAGRLPTETIGVLANALRLREFARFFVGHNRSGNSDGRGEHVIRASEVSPPCEKASPRTAVNSILILLTNK